MVEKGVVRLILDVTTRNDIDSVTSDVDLNGGKLKPKTWTKIKVTFLKGVATLYVDCEAKATAKFNKGERQIGAKIPTKVGQYGCDKLKSYFKGKMRFFSVYKPTAKRYFRACFVCVCVGFVDE